MVNSMRLSEEYLISKAYKPREGGSLLGLKG